MFICHFKGGIDANSKTIPDESPGPGNDMATNFKTECIKETNGKEIEQEHIKTTLKEIITEIEEAVVDDAADIIAQVIRPFIKCINLSVCPHNQTILNFILYYIGIAESNTQEVSNLTTGI